MISNEMEALIQQRQQKDEKKKRSQIPYAAAALIAAAILCLFLWKSNHIYAVYWVIGIAIGIALRYSRFCFAGAFRDPFLLGNTRLLRGLLIALMISTVGFAVIQHGYLKNNTIDYTRIPGCVTSVGIHTMIGAFIFGVGMTIAGGCASGVLMRMGEGHALPLFALLGFLIGTTLGAKNYPFWYDKIIKKASTIYFPEYLDLKVVVIIQLIILMCLYKLAVWYEEKR
mgnify:FL=1